MFANKKELIAKPLASIIITSFAIGIIVFNRIRYRVQKVFKKVPTRLSAINAKRDRHRYKLLFRVKMGNYRRFLTFQKFIVIYVPKDRLLLETTQGNKMSQRNKNDQISYIIHFIYLIELTNVLIIPKHEEFVFNNLIFDTPPIN